MRFFSASTTSTKPTTLAPTATSPQLAEAVATLPPLPPFDVTWKLPTPQDYALMCALSAYSPSPHSDETRWQKAVFSDSAPISQFLQDWKDEGWYRYCVFLPSASKDASLSLQASVFINDFTRQIVIAFDGNNHTDYGFLGIKKLLNAVGEKRESIQKSIARLLQGDIAKQNGLFSVLNTHGRSIGNMPTHYQLSLTGYGIGGWFALMTANLYRFYNLEILPSDDLFRGCKPLVATFDIPGDENLFNDPIAFPWEKPPNYTSYVGPPTFLNTLTPHHKLESLRFIGLGEDSTDPDAYSNSSLHELLAALLEAEPATALPEIFSPTVTASSSTIALRASTTASLPASPLKEQRGQIYALKRWPVVAWSTLYGSVPSVGSNAAIMVAIETFVISFSLLVLSAATMSGAILSFIAPSLFSLFKDSRAVFLQSMRLSTIQKGAGRNPDSSDYLQPLDITFDYRNILHQEMAIAAIPPAIKVFLRFLVEAKPRLPEEYAFLKKISVVFTKRNGVIEGIQVKGTTSAQTIVDTAGKLLFACYQEQLPELPIWNHFTKWLNETAAKGDQDAKDLHIIISQALAEERITTTRSATPKPWDIGSSSATSISAPKALSSVEESMLKASKAKQWEWACMLMGPTIDIVPRTQPFWRNYFTLLQERDYQNAVKDVLNNALSENPLPEDHSILKAVQQLLSKQDKQYSPPSLTETVSTQGEDAVITRYPLERDGERILSKKPIRELYPTLMPKTLIRPESKVLKPQNASTLYQEYREVFITQKVNFLASTLEDATLLPSAERKALLQKQYDNSLAEYNKLNKELSTLERNIQHETDQGWKQYSRIVKTQFTLWIRAHADGSSPTIPIPEELLPIIEAVEARFGDHENQKISALWEWFYPQVLHTDLYAYNIKSDKDKSPQAVHSVSHTAGEQQRWNVLMLLAAANVDLRFPDILKKTALDYLRQHLKTTCHSTQTKAEWIIDRVLNHFESAPSWLNFLTRVRQQSLALPLFPEQNWWHDTHGTEDEKLALYIETKLESYLKGLAVKKELSPPDLMWRKQALQMLQVLDYYWIIGLKAKELIEILDQLLDHKVFHPILGKPPEILTSAGLLHLQTLVKCIVPENKREIGEKKLKERYTTGIQRDFERIEAQENTEAQLKEENKEKDQQLKEKDQRFEETKQENIILKEQLGNKDQQLKEKDQRFEETKQENIILKEQLGNKDQQLKEKDQQHKEKDQQLKEKDQQLKEKDQQLKEKDQQLKEKDQQHKEKDQRFEETKQENIKLQRQNEELRKQIQEHSEAPPPEQRGLLSRFWG